jgi:hypothetical protein
MFRFKDCVCVCVCVCVCETTLGTVVRGADCLVCSESDTLPLLNILVIGWCAVRARALHLNTFFIG